MKTVRTAGFTLTEIMIVLAIVSMLFGLVGLKVMNSFKKAQVSTAKNQIALYEQALQAYYLDNSMYPSTQQGLEALIRKPAVGKIPQNYNEGSYFKGKELKKDPWGEPYRYECEDYQNYIICSNGPDREPDTEDDICSE